MKTIKLGRKEHRGKKCIFFEIENDNEFNALVRTYPGRLWSNTRKQWYIPDEEEALKKIIVHFRGKYRIDTTGLHEVKKEEDSVTAKLSEETEVHKNVSNSFYSNFGPVSMQVDSSTGRLIVKFEGKYDQSWVGEMKSYKGYYFDRDSKEWLLPSDKVSIESIQHFFESRNIRVIIKKSHPSIKIAEKRLISAKEIRSRPLSKDSREVIEEVSKYLRGKRYRSSTIKTYITQLSLFFRYFNDKLPEEISSEDISGFTDRYIIGLGYSSSFQNQVISAIKICYKLIGRDIKDTNELNRPRRSRPLPKIFSKEEVSRIINGTRNIKHRLILMIIYSCGLRRSEIINLKLANLNQERGTMHIVNSKGAVDRIVPVPDKTWQKINDYCQAYTPKKWLLEGPGGRQYSAASVHNIFKQSLKRAGIDKEVGVHSLRHSYATHLHEGGLDIRYIQELLGHKSSRTTEIYTYVSRRELLNIHNPIDDLDIS